MPTRSYSSLKKFETCARQYYHAKVAKDFLDKPNEASLYGNELHTAAELFVKDGAPIPERFAFARPYIEQLMTVPGTKYAELKMGFSWVGDTIEAKEFGDPDAWYHGIADLVVVDGPKAWMVDYKTGKSSRYADMRQLDLMAAALFAMFPEVNTIRSSLFFLVAGDLIKKVHKRENMLSYARVFDNVIERLDGAYASGVWNPQPSGLCGWCPVSTCEHHGEPRRRRR